LDPCINHSVLDRKITSVLFGKSPVILTGDDYGNVNVYKLHKIYNEGLLLKSENLSFSSLLKVDEDIEYQAKQLEEIMQSKLHKQEK
jgi:hypothetical protein